MTRKGATFNWTKECNTAFKLLKEKLMEDPVLISPQEIKTMLFTAMHPSIVIQVSFNRLDQEQRN